ncbi:MAG: hypothetical protein JWR69_2821 [Pedosphaera sp.]|nr:hypothetical protein [Pedosphaera sp.]
MKTAIPLRILLLCLCLVPLLGCDTTRAKSRQLARVAKDWSLVVRASQVIPVYPLTEDILPGDVFLVRTRIEDQVKVYEEKGFLPLDQLLTRLQPDHYASFYSGSYGIGTFTNTPYHWKFPDDLTKTNELLKAPRAAFPSYSFSIKRGAGINLALPVQGVPVALNLLGASSAHGDITISDAYTFGVDMESLRAQVNRWACEHTNTLLELAPNDAATNYLRVVNRVYWTGRVNISVFNDDSFSGAVSGGASKPVNLPELTATNTVNNYANALSSLSDAISTAAMPGGTLKVAAASSRSISINESFPRPLAIGYLAFDLPVLDNGELGPPIPTQAALHQAKIIPAHATKYGTDDQTPLIQRWLKSDPKHRDALREWLDTQGYAGHGITNILMGKDYAELRLKIVQHFNLH